MTDRFSDLGTPKADVVVDVGGGGEEMGEDQQNFMPEFFEEVGQIKSLMSVIRRNIKSIQDAYNKQAWTTDQKKSSELDELLDSTNSAASQVRNKLKAMKQENDRLDGESAQKRIRTNMHTVLSKKFIALVQEYQTLQSSYKEKFRERVQRQAEIVKPGVSREEVDEIIESGGDVFADKMMMDNRHSEAKNALKNIQEQQRDIKHLEKSIIELNQVFLDMATIVEQSQEQIDHITRDTTQAAAASTEAVIHLSKAEEYAMARRRRAAMLISGVVIIVLIVAGVIAALFATKVIAF